MNYRKFYAVLCAILSVFLFVSGTSLLYYIRSFDSVDAMSLDSNDRLSDLFKPFVTSKDPVNFLVMVGDAGDANTDTMMLVNYNPNGNKVNIMSIPRDTKVNVHGLTIPKINSLYARRNGTQLVIDATSDILGVNIKYYVYLNLSSFRKIIDLLDGVVIDVPIDMYYHDPTQKLLIDIKKGKQTLDGKKAEQYLRYRHPNEGYYTEEILKYYDGSDLKRINAQQNFLKELIKQKANILYISKLNEIINTVYESINTNITINEVFKLIANITDFKLDNVNMFVLPGTAQQIDGLWYFIHDKSETLEITKEHFNAKGVFTANQSSVNQNAINASSGSNNSSNNNQAAIVTTTPQPTPEPAEDFLTNNPSNTETLIEGSEIPIP